MEIVLVAADSVINEPLTEFDNPWLFLCFGRKKFTLRSPLPNVGQAEREQQKMKIGCGRYNGKETRSNHHL